MDQLRLIANPQLLANIKTEKIHEKPLEITFLMQRNYPLVVI